MRTRVPPRIATWLLVCLGYGYYTESLAGDLSEEYQQGRSQLWYWRQVTLAIFMARTRLLRATVWTLADSVIAAFAMIALGVGTFTWANVVKNEPVTVKPCTASILTEHIDCPMPRRERQ